MKEFDDAQEVQVGMITLKIIYSEEHKSAIMLAEGPNVKDWLALITQGAVQVPVEASLEEFKARYGLKDIPRSQMN